MDKLKEQLAPVQKHLFWVGCGLILLVTLFSWYRATSTLKTEHEKLVAEIDGSFNTVRNIKPNHPNENTLAGMKALIRETGEKVAKRWAELAGNQENVLVWPNVFDDQFISQVNHLRPPELTVTDGQNEISGEDKRVYRDEVKNVFPKLAAIIGTKWTGTVSASGGGSMGGATMPGADLSLPGAMFGPAGNMPGVGGKRGEEDDSLVLWNSGNQSELMNNHFSFIASDAALPSTRQILYAQEDLWVLENLLNIVKATNETNGKITHRHEAAIKTIDSIQIGRAAIHESGKVSPIGKTSAPGGMDNIGPGMMPDLMGGQMPGMDPGASGNPADLAPGADPGAASAGGGIPGATPSLAVPSNNPADNRYVDRDYQGVLSSRLVNAMQGKPERPEDVFLAVAKRVPVRLVFKMDQRRFATMLAACGNSKLPVEVKQVRINRDSAGGGSMMGDMPGGMFGAMPGGLDMMPGEDPALGGLGGASTPFGGGAAVNPNRKSIADSTVDPNEVKVELYGIVYIYNPVNRAVLGLTEEAPQTPPTVTTAPTPTATGPAAPPVNTGAATGPAAPAAVN